MVKQTTQASQTTVTVDSPSRSAEPPRLKEKKVIFRTYQVIWYLLGLVEVLLLFRFAFKMFGANPATPFVRFLYALSAGLVSPFRGIFPVGVVEASLFEWASLVAMAVYAVVAYGLIYFLQLVKPVDSQEVEEVVDNP